MHVEFEDQRRCARPIARPPSTTARAPARAVRDHAGVERRGIEPVEHQVDRLHLVVADVGDDAAERRGDAGIARHQRRLAARPRGSARRHAARRRRRRASPRSLPDHGRARSRPAGSRRPCLALAIAHDGLGRRHDVEAERLARHGSRSRAAPPRHRAAAACRRSAARR